MKKILPLVAVLMFCLCIPLTASAMDKYLNGDPNFPLTGGHANFWEYTDLSSCTIAEENDEYYKLAVGYVRVSRKEQNPYRVRYFLYYKDGATRPQYYDDNGWWISLPPLKSMSEANLPFQPYRQKYHPDQFHMLRAACREIFGIELEE